MSGTALTPGSVLAGRFRLDVLLDGSDGAGLWRATDRVLARNVAVHVLPDTDPRAGALLTAARTSALVSDVRLLRVLDAAAEEGLVYVVNEWGFGASLDQLLADGPIAPRRAAWVVREVAEAIATAHRNGVAHGRLVPENVMVTDAGSVKVIGFVIDEVLNGRADFTHHRVTGGEPMDAFAADVVNLGALLYAALVGRWPGTEGSRLPPAPADREHPLRPRQVRAGVPRPLDAICTRVLDADHHPHSVPLGSAHEVYAALSDFIGDGAGAGATTLPGPHPPGRPGPGVNGPDTSGPDTSGHDTGGQSRSGAGTGIGAGQAAGGVESTTVLGRDELPGTTGDTAAGATGHDTGPEGTDEDADTQETPEQRDAATDDTQVHEALAPPGADDESRPGPEADAGPRDAPRRGAGADGNNPARNGQESLDPEATQVGAPVFVDDDPPGDASDAATSTGPGSTWSAARDPGPSSAGPASAGPPLPGDSSPGDSSPGDSSPGDSSPGDSSPGDSSPGDSSSGDSSRGDSSREPNGAGSRAPGSRAPASSGQAQGREEEHEAWARSWGEDRERARLNPAAAPPPLPDPPMRPLFADDHHTDDHHTGARPPATPAHGTPHTHDDRRHSPPDAEPRRGNASDSAESLRTGWAGSVPTSWGPDETPPPVSGPGWSDRRGAVPGRSWLRLAVGLGVLVLLVVVAVVAVDLSRGRSDVADPAAEPSGSASPSATAGRPIKIAAVSDFDPEGDPPRENPDRAGLAADGKAGTAWNTSTYFDPLERLKSGVGLLVDLGSPQDVGAVRLRLEGSPTSLTLFAAPKATTAPSDVEGLTSVGTADGAGRSVTLRPDEPVTTRWLVVWLTSLPRVSGGYQGRVAEITVRS